MSVTFDGATKIIQVDAGVTTIDVRTTYSRWKDWVLLSDNAKWAAAFRVGGGDEVRPGQFAPTYFYLTNGWTVRPDSTSGDHTLAVGLNLYSDPSTNPKYTFVSGVAIDSLASDSVIGSSSIEIGDINAIADAVWDEDLSDHITAGTFGRQMGKKLLTVAKFIGLK